jgi:hypothetical protein
MDVGMTGEGQQAKTTGHTALLQEIRERSHEATEAWNPIHDQATADVRFAVKGEQWPQEVKAARENAKAPRPMLTINQLPKYLRQVLGDGKQNRLSITVSAVEGNRTQKIRNLAGTRDYTYAQIMEGLIRNIEYTSKAERAYDKALEHCADGGFGWLRVIKRYSRPDGFEQELAIRGVRNRWSVLMDPVAMMSDEPDMADANYGLVTTVVSATDARRKWGKDVQDAVGVVENEQVALESWWTEKGGLRLVEYYGVEEKKVRYYLLSDGKVLEEEDYLAAKDELAAQQIMAVQDRKGIKRCVYWSLTDGRDILEGPFLWDGGYIPLVPVLGPEVLLDGKFEYQSLFRHAHDAQRGFNYWYTAATEAVAMAPKSPWIADAASVAGYESDYETASHSPVQLLRYRHREGVPPPARVQAASNPAAEISMALQANENVKSTVGMFDASVGARSNETSGIAIENRQREADVGTFMWHDALAKAVEQIGRILCDVAPKIYDTQRQMRLRMPDDSEDWVTLNEEVRDEEGNVVYTVDLASCRYDAVVKSGPSFTTQRKAAAASMTEFMRVVPPAAGVIGDLAAEAMDWPNADKVAKRLKKTVPPQMLEPSELEEMNQGQQQEPPPPSPEQQLAAKELELKDKELQLREKELEVKALEIAGKAEQAKAMKPENVKEIVADALAELLAGPQPTVTR